MNQTHQVTVFRKVSSFLETNEIYTLARLNKYFHLHFMNSETNYYISTRKLSEILFQDITEDNYKVLLKSIAGIEVSSLSETIEYLRFACNLLKNPYGGQGFTDWEVSNGGNGWSIEDWGTFDSKPVCFVSSYAWGTLKQIIELPRLGEVNRKLFVGCPVKRRFDCGGTAKLTVKLDSDRGEEITKEVEAECREQESEDPGQRFPWDLMSISVDVDDSMRRASISFAGKDSNFWAGHYGPRFGYCFARILVRNEDLRGNAMILEQRFLKNGVGTKATDKKKGKGSGCESM